MCDKAFLRSMHTMISVAVFPVTYDCFCFDKCKTFRRRLSWNLFVRGYVNEIYNVILRKAWRPTGDKPSLRAVMLINKVYCRKFNTILNFVPVTEFCRRHLSNAFSPNGNICMSIKIFTVPEDPRDNKSAFGSGKGLAPNRRQANYPNQVMIQCHSD